MSENISFSKTREISLRIDDVDFRLLVDSKASEAAGAIRQTHLTLHNHISAELFVCIRGEENINLRDGTLSLRAGDAALIPPGLEHCKCPDDADSEGYAVSFTCYKKNDMGAEKLYKRLLPYVSGEHARVMRGAADLCRGVADIISEAQSGEDVICAMHMVELLLRAPELAEEGGLMARKYDGEKKENYDARRMMLLDQIVDGFYMHDLGSEEVAGYLYVSVRQLDRIVKKRYGRTLYRVIMDKRLSTAEQLLRTTDMTVEQVGNTVGFSSISGFYREFVKRHGVTPAQYRNNG